MKDGVIELEAMLDQEVTAEKAARKWMKLELIYRKISENAEAYVKGHTTAFTHRGRVRRRTARALLNLCRNDLQKLGQSMENLPVGGEPPVSWRTLLDGQTQDTVQGLIAQKDISQTLGQIQQAQDSGLTAAVVGRNKFKDDELMTVDEFENLMANLKWSGGVVKQLSRALERYDTLKGSQMTQSMAISELQKIVNETDELIKNPETNRGAKIVFDLLHRQAKATMERWHVDPSNAQYTRTDDDDVSFD